MRITLNLATKPWVDTGTQVRRLRIALGVCVAVCLLSLLGLHFEASAAQRAQAKRDAMDAQQAKLNNEKRAYEAELQLPKNQAVLERSQFLNGIFAEKSFSWTSVMMDLENVMPAGVQVASLDPQVMPDGGIVVRLRVRGDRDRDVELLRNLERSKRFRSPRLAAEASESQAPGPGQQVSLDAGSTVAFEILSDYNSVTPEAEKAESKATAGSSTAPPVKHGGSVRDDGGAGGTKNADAAKTGNALRGKAAK
jgi:type IV pilus assembly protein PilN